MNADGLLRMAGQVDDLIGDLPAEVGCTASFRADMAEALSGDPLVPFTVADVLSAMGNWLTIAMNQGVQNLNTPTPTKREGKK